MDFIADFNSTQRFKRAVIDGAGTADLEIVAAVAGKKIRVYQVVLIASGTTTVRFESAAGGTALTGQLSLAVNVGFSSGFCPAGHFQTAAGQALSLEVSGAAVSVDGWVVYAEV